MTYNFTDLSEADAQLLIAGLGKLPLEQAYDLFNRLQAQAAAQQQAPVAAPATKKKTK